MRFVEGVLAENDDMDEPSIVLMCNKYSYY